MVPVWMILSDLFNVTIIQCQITWKWYDIQLYLQWPTNRKSYMIYQTTPFSITLPPVSRPRRSLTLKLCMSYRFWNIQWNTNRDLHTPHSIMLFRMILNDLAKYSITRRVAQFRCDSWDSCSVSVSVSVNGLNTSTWHHSSPSFALLSIFPMHNA